MKLRYFRIFTEQANLSCVNDLSGKRPWECIGLDEGNFSAEVYRQRATNMRRTAESVTDPKAREELLRLAESWERLADIKSPAPQSWAPPDKNRH
jgi:hypothetical protein